MDTCPLDGNPVAFTDEVTLRGYCIDCASSEITSSLNAHLQYLDTLLPLEAGERVECRTMARYWDGTGTIERVSVDLHDGGTPVHPAYLVELDDGQHLWYTSICLTRTHHGRGVRGV